MIKTKNFLLCFKMVLLCQHYAQCFWVLLCSKLCWHNLPRPRCQVAMRRVFQKLCLCRQILVGDSQIPDSVFQPHPRPSSRHVMNSLPLLQPFARTNYTKHSYFFHLPSLWNSIPEEMVSVQSYLAFKRHLKNYLVIS